MECEQKLCCCHAVKGGSFNNILAGDKLWIRFKVLMRRMNVLSQIKACFSLQLKWMKVFSHKTSNSINQKALYWKPWGFRHCWGHTVALVGWYVGPVVGDFMTLMLCQPAFNASEHKVVSPSPSFTCTVNPLEQHMDGTFPHSTRNLKKKRLLLVCSSEWTSAVITLSPKSFPFLSFKWRVQMK